MAIAFDFASADIKWTTAGASAGCHVGEKFALLHCGKNFNRGAGDRMPAGDVPTADAVTMRASVFASAGPRERDLGSRQFGMAQVTELFAYDFLYAGHIASEGSALVNMKSGFSANPSLDSRPSTGQSIDDRIFDPSRMNMVDASGGFRVTVDIGDHPNNSIPLTFENRRAGATNYLARVNRVQHFIVFFMTRETANAPIAVLGRLGWAASWRVEFKWSPGATKPSAIMRESNLFPGKFVSGGADATDRFAQIAVNRTPPSTKTQDDSTTDAVFDQRKAPMLVQDTSWSTDVPQDFFK